MTTVVIILVGCWLAVAVERYLKRERSLSAKERAFVAESTTEAYAIKQQREAIKQAIDNTTAATPQPAPDAGLSEVVMRPNERRI